MQLARQVACARPNPAYNTHHNTEQTRKKIDALCAHASRATIQIKKQGTCQSVCDARASNTRAKHAQKKWHGAPPPTQAIASKRGNEK